jgi:hypothetical protein
MAMSNYWFTHLLNHAFGKETYSAPAHYFVALSTANPLADGSGLAEPVGNNYSRVSTEASDWSEVSSFATENLADVEFPAASGSWGTLTHFAIFDASTNGNLLFFGTLSEGIAVGEDQAPLFYVGNLVCSMGA